MSIEEGVQVHSFTNAEIREVAGKLIGGVRESECPINVESGTRLVTEVAFTVSVLPLARELLKKENLSVFECLGGQVTWDGLRLFIKFQPEEPKVKYDLKPESEQE